MLNVEKDLLEAVKNGCGEEQRIKFIKELNDPEIDSALMYNGIIECLGNDDYCDGVYDTILALQKERLENEAIQSTVKKSATIYLIIAGIGLAGFGVARFIYKKIKKKKEVQND